MATTPSVTHHVAATLRGIAAELGFLPELEKQWDQEPDSSKASWQLEWEEMLARLTRIAQEERTGTLAAAERVQYTSVIRDLLKSAPTLAQLGVKIPADLIAP